MADEPGAPAPRAARQRPGALRGAGRGRVRRGERAVRRWSRRRPPTSASTARPPPTPSAPAPPAGRWSSSTSAGAGDLDGHPPARLRRHAAAGRAEADLAARRDHDPRHRPRRLPALPAQGDLGGARLVPQDAAGQGRRATTGASRCACPSRRCPTPMRDAARRRHDPAGARRSARAPRRSRGRCVANAVARPRGRPALRRGGAGHRALGVPDAGRHVRHARDRDQPERHHHRHQPQRRPRAGRAGAAVVAIVNRRNSDLVDRSDGVLYTSDGRDVEMSVASTKAFYSQVAAGYLLALGIAAAVGHARRRPRARAAHRAARRCPTRCARSSTQRPSIADDRAPPRAVATRPGPSSATAPTTSPARELRIKLSELCYKAIACDATEDKKHIDLSSEPMTLVCAAGPRRVRTSTTSARRSRSTARTAASPIVIAERGPSRARFGAAADVIVGARGASRARLRALARWPVTCSATRPRSRSTPRRARCARRAPRSRPAPRGPVDELLVRLGPAIEPPGAAVPRGPAGRAATTAPSRRAPACRSRRCSATPPAISPLDAYELEHGKVGTPSTVVQDLTAALTRGIEELTRPIDAIKHQAKTVTVGISRSDETLLQVPLVAAALAAGTPRDGLSYRALRTLVDLDAAVEEVTGFTRYRIEGDPDGTERDGARRRPRRCGRRPGVAHRRRPAPHGHEAPGRRPSARSPPCAVVATGARW